MSNRDHKSKTKRRSKNDNSGRDFICGCSKRYLSYPALYTHIKQKHKGVTPPGTNTSQLNLGRGRGRPRKQIGEIDRKFTKFDVGDGFGEEGYGQEGELLNHYNLTGPLDQEQMKQISEKLEQEYQFFKDLKCGDGQANPLDWFCNVSHMNFNTQQMREVTKAQMEK